MKPYSATLKDKHLKLDQKKIERLKVILKVHTETEAISQAIDLILAEEEIKETLRQVKGKAHIENVFG